MKDVGGKLLVGLIGAGIQRSLTPAMQEEEARQQGLRLHYQLIDLDQTPDSIQQLPALIHIRNMNHVWKDMITKI
jgi:shikimate dehydrogenase